MRHFGSGVGHVNNTVIPSVNVPLDLDNVDSEEEGVDSDISVDSNNDLSQLDQMVTDLDEREDPEEEMAGEENDEEIDDPDLDGDGVEEDVDFEEDDGYGSL